MLPRPEQRRADGQVLWLALTKAYEYLALAEEQASEEI
jgi:hypothetical protein